MFHTEIHLVTLIILVFQLLVLFSQSLFVLARPNDIHRKRFITLISCYIIHNLFAGLFPDKNIPISLLLQNSLAYAGGILVAFYLFYYIKKEFEIDPLHGFFSIEYFLVIVIGAFIILFMVPFYFFESLALSKKLFLGVPLAIATIILYKFGKTFWELYKNRDGKEGIYQYKVIASYLGVLTISLMPVINAIGDYQTIQQSVTNFGFFLIMIIYIIELIYGAQKEAVILSKIKDNTVTTYEIQIAETLTKELLDKLANFEKNKEYLQGKVTLHLLAKKFKTNPRYLSQIVNKYKGKSFKYYISDLKIEHIKYRLNLDQKFRQYTQKAIASEIGYTSDALSKAFYKKENIRFSKYLKKIRDK